MSYPSLNASSKALPPPSPNKKRLVPSFIQKRRSSHDLPMMAPPRPQHSHSSPSLGMGAQVVSTPEEALSSWRRESIDLKLADHRRTSRDSLGVDSNHSGPRRSLSSRRPSYTSVQEEDQLPSPPASSAGSSSGMEHARSQSSFAPTLPAPLSPSSFSATLLSSKTVRLPRQPFAVESSTTLVQLQVAGQTFIIPLANLQRSQSNLAHFVGACLEIDNESETESKGMLSETDDESHTGSLRYSSDSADLVPPTFTPPPNLRQSSLSKLERLGVLPPPTPSRRPISSSASSFGTLTTPRAENFPSTITTASYQPSPARSVAKSTRSSAPSGPSTRFLNLLLLRSPEPYTAITYFYSSETLLPSLRTTTGVEGEEECKGGCPLCGEAERVRRLREVEMEARWLGLTSLVSLCKAEGRRKEREQVTAVVQPKGQRKGEGWI